MNVKVLVCNADGTQEVVEKKIEVPEPPVWLPDAEKKEEEK